VEWGVSCPLADYLGPNSKVGVPPAPGQVNSEQSCLFTASITSLRWYDTASFGWILQQYYTYCTQCLSVCGQCFFLYRYFHLLLFVYLVVTYQQYS